MSLQLAIEAVLWREAVAEKKSAALEKCWIAFENELRAKVLRCHGLLLIPKPGVLVINMDEKCFEA